MKWSRYESEGGAWGFGSGLMNLREINFFVKTTNQAELISPMQIRFWGAILEICKMPGSANRLVGIFGAEQTLGAPRNFANDCRMSYSCQPNTTRVIYFGQQCWKIIIAGSGPQLPALFATSPQLRQGGIIERPAVHAVGRLPLVVRNADGHCADAATALVVAGGEVHMINPAVAAPFPFRAQLQR